VSIFWIRRDDIPKLKYMTMCIKESMRLHCPVPFIERELTKEMTIDGVTLPKGSVIDIQIYNLHHNPTVWEEPMVWELILFKSGIYFLLINRNSVRIDSCRRTLIRKTRTPSCLSLLDPGKETQYL
jgi:hypothetical protein